jgi:hypothetical protein
MAMILHQITAEPAAITGWIDASVGQNTLAITLDEVINCRAGFVSGPFVR